MWESLGNPHGALKIVVEDASSAAPWSVRKTWSRDHLIGGIKALASVWPEAAEKHNVDIEVIDAQDDRILCLWHDVLMLSASQSIRFDTVARSTSTFNEEYDNDNRRKFNIPVFKPSNADYTTFDVVLFMKNKFLNEVDMEAITDLTFTEYLFHAFEDVEEVNHVLNQEQRRLREAGISGLAYKTALISAVENAKSASFRTCLKEVFDMSPPPVGTSFEVLYGYIETMTRRLYDHFKIEGPELTATKDAVVAIMTFVGFNRMVMRCASPRTLLKEGLVFL